jgi:hypothetical protein
MDSRSSLDSLRSCGIWRERGIWNDKRERRLEDKRPPETEKNRNESGYQIRENGDFEAKKRGSKGWKRVIKRVKTRGKQGKSRGEPA